jgi:hypothetical protein
MKLKTTIQKYGTVTHVVHEPGNGTRYEAVGARMPADVPEYGGAWLVTFPLIGVSHFFHSGNFLSVGYVAEKLAYQRNGMKICEVDLHEMTKCITTITGGKHNAATDNTGRLPTLRIAQ